MKRMVYLNDSLAACEFLCGFYNQPVGYWNPAFEPTAIEQLFHYFKGDLRFRRTNGWWFVEAFVPSFEAESQSEKFEPAVTVAIYRVLKKQQDIMEKG